MNRRSWQTSILLGIACLCPAQNRISENQRIEYTSPAVPAYKVVDDIARLAEKKLRVSDELANAPMIVRLHDASYSETLEWLATALHASWLQKSDYKVLSRTNFATLTLKNVGQRARATAITQYLQDRRRLAILPPLTFAVAKQSILTLYDPIADKSSPEYQSALQNSADSLLIERSMAAVHPTDLAGVTFPNHAAFSDNPHFLQYALRISTSGVSRIFEDQNVWTKTLQQLAKTHPELRAAADERVLIDPHGCRLLLVFADPVDGLPTHVVASVIGFGGYTRVRAEANIKIPMEQPKSENDWPSLGLGTITWNPLSAEFLSAVNAPAGTQLPADLKNALLSSGQGDPMRLVISDGLLQVATAKNWNMVACPPDVSLLDPAIQSLPHEGGVEGAAFISALENTCQVNLKDGLAIVSPIDPLAAQANLVNRLGMDAYLESVARVGYSSTAAEGALAGLNSTAFDPSLVELYAHLLQPSATPYLDASMAAVALYGSLTPDQRKWLNDGMSYSLSDLTHEQEALMTTMMLDDPQHVLIDRTANNLPVNPSEPEITNLIDGPITPGEAIRFGLRKEKVVRVRGVDTFGRTMDQVLTLDEAPSLIYRKGPWRSIQYAFADANTVKITIRASAVADVVHFLREYPNGWSPLGGLNALPADVRSALSKRIQPEKKVSGGPKPRKK